MIPTHPSVDVLRALVAGDPVEGDVSTIEDHIAHCDTCQEQLELMPAISPLEPMLRSRRVGLSQSEGPPQAWLVALKDKVSSQLKSASSIRQASTVRWTLKTGQ